MKNFQLLSTTTYKDLENYFNDNLYNQIVVGGEKREFVFNIGEYGAILFHRCIEVYLKDNSFIIAESSLVSSEKEIPQGQFIKYHLANGIKLHFIIEDEEYNDDTQREDLSGYPLNSMLLKFKEII